MDKKNIDKFINASLAIEARDAKEAGALGYMARALVQATMPHKKVVGTEFKRHNGAFKLIILADSEIGLPYGSIPRLLIAWLTTEAVRTKSREIVLGNSLSEFMKKLGIVPTGGFWGSITRLRDQMKRLFSCSISCNYGGKESIAGLNIHIVDKYQLWWAPQKGQDKLWQSTLLLGQNFFDEITKSPVPLDIGALKTLKRSPLAIDIYCWLTFRMSYLKKATCIPWGLLENQFGADYKRTRKFKESFLYQLRKVQTVYSKCNVENLEKGLILKPSKPHISTSIKRIIHA